MEKQEEEETLSEFLIRTLDETFIDNIPMDSIKDLPKFYMYFFGAIFELLSLAMLVYFMYSGYIQGVTSKFMSVDPTSGECNEIPKSVSGTFTADQNGYWEGEPGFDYSLAVYSMSLADAKITAEDYSLIMTQFQAQIHYIGNLSLYQDLATNLITWMSFQFICNPATDTACNSFVGQTIEFTANAAYAMSLSYVSVTLSDVISDCGADSLSTYDLANAMNNGAYNYLTFMNDNTCNHIVDPVSLGYNPVLEGDEFSLSVDVRALVEASAVNYDILTKSALTQVSGQESNFYYHNNFTYIGNWYYDPIYPGMHPFYCVVNQHPRSISNLFTPEGSVNTLCMLQQGNLTGIPVFNHFGAGSVDDGALDNTPKPCACNEFGRESQCDVFNLVTGMAFFDQMSLADAVWTWLNVTVNGGGSYELNKQAYNASWAAAASTYSPNVNPIINDAAWRNSSYNWCQSDDFGTCSLLIFNSYGNTVFDKAITEYLLTLDNGSCSPQFQISHKAFERLIQNPPTPIIENYYDCVLLPYDAAFNAAGIASGNVQIIIPIIVFAFLPLMFLWLTLTGNVQPKPEYEKEELDATLALMALQILRIRDSKVRGIKKEGLLILMTRELVSAARDADGTCVDSDDSDDEDDQPPPSRQPFSGSPNKPTARPQQSNNGNDDDTSCNPMYNDSNGRNNSNDDAPARPPPRRIKRMSSAMDIDQNAVNGAGSSKPGVAIKRKSLNATIFLTSNGRNANANDIRGADSDDEEDGPSGGYNNNSPSRVVRRGSANRSFLIRQASSLPPTAPSPQFDLDTDVETGQRSVEMKEF